MDDRRRSKRLELEAKLVMKRLSDGDAFSEEVSIRIIDVSKTGIGFTCDKPLEIGAVYEGYLTIWTKETIHAFIEIVRIIKEEDTFSYGGIFIGMPEMDAARIAVYDLVQESEKKNS
ncbi:MAG: PilZ domain-containing protein [Lachnospiraceae bacterium]|nr:PilZ domain-containing protein [Lachnospiraceae bacterium]